MRDVVFAEGDFLKWGKEKRITFATDQNRNIMWIFGWIDEYVDEFTPSVVVTTLIHEDLHDALKKIDPALSHLYHRLECCVVSPFVASLGIGLTRAFI